MIYLTNTIPRALTKAQKDALIALGQRCFNATKTDIAQHIDDADHMVLAISQTYSGRPALPVGFAAVKHFEDVLYLAGSFVDPEFRSEGLYTRMREHTIKHSSEPFVAATTQNPLIYKGLKKILPDLQPRLDGRDELRMAKTIAEKLGIPIDDKGVHRGRYGQCLYANIPFADTNTNKLFDNVAALEYDKGDALLLYAKVRLCIRSL